jgi:hypothetical protein
MAPKKKRTRKDDVDPRVLRKIKEPKLDLADLEDTEDDDDDVVAVDEEKPFESEEENY